MKKLILLFIILFVSILNTKAQVNDVVKKDVDTFVSLLISKCNGVIYTKGCVVDDEYIVKIKFPDTFTDELMKNTSKFKDSKYLLLRDGWRYTKGFYVCSFSKKFGNNGNVAFITLTFKEGGNLVIERDNRTWILSCSGYTLN